jgi:hypothetical protein
MREQSTLRKRKIAPARNTISLFRRMAFSAIQIYEMEAAGVEPTPLLRDSARPIGQAVDVDAVGPRHDGQKNVRNRPDGDRPRGYLSDVNGKQAMKSGRGYELLGLFERALRCQRDHRRSAVFGVGIGSLLSGDDVSTLETSMGLCALLNLGVQALDLIPSIRFLLKTQSPVGDWRRSLLYFGGPSKSLGWGSEELTSAFCLEGLARFALSSDPSREMP